MKNIRRRPHSATRLRKHSLLTIIRRNWLVDEHERRRLQESMRRHPSQWGGR